ncbi:MAG: alanine--tRNA ligase [archaeon]|nr:alanine--tRNA ligase [archaeon]MCR4323446.1 alanine--tRNA ligase [Nanoarchaeota archaeon]
MKRKELIETYLKFFKSKKHKEVANVSLVPENDPSVLFTTAGMHPLVPFLLGQKHPQGKRLVGVQRCIRTGDIEEVGDTSHHTFFEMLGNWSLGDYFKKEAIEMSFEFLTKVLKMPVERLAFSVFEGDGEVDKDTDSADIWASLGVSNERIVYLEENWWGPAGKTGPCGPDTEMFYWKPNKGKLPGKFNPKDSNWLEIWNDVFMEYNKDTKGNYNLAKQENVDTGMGVERTLAVLNGLEDNYLGEVWQPIIQKIEMISKHKYGEDEIVTRAMRIVADHIKAAVFIINDGIVPGNSEQGYVLRRLIRRAVRYGRVLGIESFTTSIADVVYELYGDYKLDARKITLELANEEERFLKTLAQGLRIFDKVAGSKKMSGTEAFLLYQSYGFPIEMTLELAKEKGIKVDEKEYSDALNKHSELSRTAAAGKFKSGLADDSEATTRLHTATHLLLAAMNKVLPKLEGMKEIQQRGSNINAERARFDFSYDRKLTDDEVKELEDLVNGWIWDGAEVKRDEMSLDEAKKFGAAGIFEDKYKVAEKISVYSIGDGKISKEICTGPHVKSLKELQGCTFKIKKQDSVGAGARRVKVVLE